MTDYGEFTREDRAERAERLRKEEAERARRERERVDREFEAVVLAPKPICSSNSNLVEYIKHIKNVRAALKSASDAGFCLDEIMDGLKELESETLPTRTKS